MSEQNQNSNTIAEPSTFTAIKDQFLGAAKEVIGSVFNQDLQQAGAQQRIHGENEMQAMKSQTPQSSDPTNSQSSTEAPRSWFGTSAPSNNPAQPSEPSKGWFGYSDPEKTLMESSEPPKSWFGSSSETVKPSPTVPEPSTMSAIKDQFMGSAKEVIGAVFNEDLQNSGAEQRIQGERTLRNLQDAMTPERDGSWSKPSVSDPSEPSKIFAVKDQLIGSTKEALGSVFSQNLHDAGVEQRIHGEREYETAIIAKESQESLSRGFDDKKLVSAGLIPPTQPEKMVNA